MKNDAEHRLQASCIQWFRLQHRKYSGLLFAIPNGGKREVKTYRKRDGSIVSYCPEGKKLKDEGALRGVADLFLAIPNKTKHGLFIEMKIKGGRQSPEQREFEKNVTSVGYQYSVCYSLMEFISIVTNYLKS